MQTAHLNISVEYDPTLTDAEGIANAADVLLETALSTTGVLDEYGNPKFGSFFIAAEFANSKGIAKRLGRWIRERAKGLPSKLCGMCLGSTQRPIRKDITRTAKYLLFDFDAGEMATSTVYDTYDDAKEDAAEFDSVIVIPLVFEEE